MTNTNLTVHNDLVVSLDYTLKLDDGQVVDTSSGREPLELLQGHGNIIPGLEKALEGMSVNEEKDVIVAPAEGYGQADPDNFAMVPPEAFPEDLTLTEGMGLQMHDDSSGRVFEAYIAEIRSDGVLLNLNHPLAGKTLHFHVKIVGLRQATTQELAHGHAHSANDPHHH